MKKEKEVQLVLANVSLAPLPKAISAQFAKFKERIIKPNEVRDLDVNTDESQTIAESKIKQINGLKSEIKEKANELKDPLNFVKDLVLTEAKILDDDLTMSKDILSKKVMDYKNLKIARLRAEEDEKRKKLEEESQRKEIILNRITNILSNFTSFLFGGDVKTVKGELMYVDAPSNVEDLDKIKELISSGFPDFEMFDEYGLKIAGHYNDFMSDLEQYKIYLADGNISAINEMKVRYYNLCNREIEQAKKIIEKEEIQIDKKLEKEVKDASKGLRETLVYDVINLQEVPDKFKTIDVVKINDYIARNRDSLKEMAKQDKGHEPIPGLKFRINKTNVTY